MAELTVSRVRSMSEAEVRAAFESFMAEEKEFGLEDIKFAVSVNEKSTVVGAMREILLIEAAAADGLCRSYSDF